MTYIQVTRCSCNVNVNFKNQYKWSKIRCSFVSKYQILKMALCGVLIGKIRLFHSVYFSWFRMTTSDNEWQRVTSGTTSGNEWQRVVQRVTTSGNEGYNEWQRVIQRVTTRDKKWQWVTASDRSGTTNENGPVHFKEWMIAILSITKTDTLLLQRMDGCN